MPWTVKDVDQHKKGLDDKAKKQWVLVANSTLAQCLKDGGKDCEAKAIKSANGVTMQKEAGRTYNKKNESLLRQAYRALRDALKALGDDADLDADDDEKKAEEAAGGFSTADLSGAIGAALIKSMPECRILDVFPDQNEAVYAKGWSGFNAYKVSYDIDESGNVTFGDPIEVTRKVTYTPLKSKGDAKEPVVEESVVPQTDGTVIELIERATELIEKSVDKDGTVPIKIIRAGWGSSGYYPREVLQRDGPKIFKSGLHMFWDHQTAREEAEKPEGSLDRLAAVLTEDAKWLEDGKYGAGLYARAKVNSRFKDVIDELAPHIGVSIRANGRARMGEAEGKKGPIVETLSSAKSIDYVTMPGAGGRVIELFESAIKREDKPMADDKELNELKLRVQRQQEAINNNRAERLISDTLVGYDLPPQTKARVKLTLMQSYPLSESGDLDDAKFVEVIKTTVTSEVKYLTELGAFGRITNLGSGGTPPELKDEDFDKEMASIFSELGLSEAGAKHAVKGRE